MYIHVQKSSKFIVTVEMFSIWGPTTPNPHPIPSPLMLPPPPPPYSDDYTLQISPNSGAYNDRHLDYFKFVGRICGMAVYHNRLIDGTKDCRKCFIVV